jgi:GTP-binding protein era
LYLGGNMKSGFVSFIGRPNVGKSTLLNSILNKKVVITSNKPQTTRNLIQGIYNEDDTQIIFVDTPGIHKAHNKLGRALNKQAYFTINDVDIIIMVVDITEKVGSGDKFVIDILKNIENKPVFLVINKIDKLPREEILSKIEEYMSLYNFTEVIPVSARKKDNIDRLIEVIKKYLPDNIKYFDSDTVTNSSPEFIISELIREKVLELTDEEVPHSVTCIVDELYEEEKIINIGASIIVDRENLKKIIIGKNGNMIKEIGIRARKDIEEYFGKQVYLDLFVKVIPKWRDKEKFLNMIGYKDFLNK